jgi:MOSC domain-containing protein YiiM
VSLIGHYRCGVPNPSVLTVNVGSPEPNPFKRTGSTGIGKRPAPGLVLVRAPGAKHGGLGSGLVGDAVMDRQHHGGDEQAVYAYAREDLDAWERELDRELPGGSFGENLTTVGIDVTDSRMGEIWQIGTADEPGRGCLLQITSPRIPCATFRGRMGIKGWLKTFTQAGNPGAYLRVLTPGEIASGDTLTVAHRPAHDVTVGLCFRAITTERELLPRLLAAGDDLTEELREMATEGKTFELD